MASFNFLSMLIVPRPTKYEEERQHNRQPVAKEVASGKDFRRDNPLRPDKVL